MDLQCFICFTLPETNIAPENGWLEYDCFLLGPGLFSGAMAVSFREGMHPFGVVCLIPKTPDSSWKPQTLLVTPLGP